MSVSEDKPKKILIFSIAYIPLVGGAELAVKEITDRISDIQFDMITARIDKNLARSERIGNINVYRIGFGLKTFDKYIFTFFGFLKALKLHLKNRYDIIWPIMAAYSSFAVLFKIFHLKPRIVLTIQEGDPIEYIIELKRFKIFRPIYKFYFKTVDQVTAISNFLAGWMKELGVKKEKITIVPNGVDVNKFKSQISNLKSDKLKEELRIKDDEKVLITTSRLVEKNAIGDIIEALKYLSDNIKFLILGKGPLEEKLRFHVSSSKFQDRVMFLGHIEPQEVPQYLAISDIFVRPSLSEGLGTSFLEAMAAGIPIIATKVGGIPDFLKDKETGLFCEINNPKSIAEKVKLLLENDELRGKIIGKAKEMVIRNYDWNLIAEKMKNIFDKLLS